MRRSHGPGAHEPDGLDTVRIFSEQLISKARTASFEIASRRPPDGQMSNYSSVRYSVPCQAVLYYPASVAAWCGGGHAKATTTVKAKTSASSSSRRRFAQQFWLDAALTRRGLWR